ncbi:hypothetical protein MOZ60_10785, partial [Stecheria sp. CLA-KB-P133]|nr:hypothetical protein [Stecheria sp. CLA-KB-P133]
TEHSDYNLMARICGTRLFNWRSAKAERRTDEAEQPFRFSGLCRSGTVQTRKHKRRIYFYSAEEYAAGLRLCQTAGV